MCLTVATGFDGFPLRVLANVNIQKYLQTATEDICVYKIINENDTSLYQLFQYSPNTLYDLGKYLKVADIEEYSKYFCVYEGFHTYRSKCFWAGLDAKLVEFTIPKGAKYFIGINNDIVSNMIRSGDLKNLLRSL